MDVHPTKNVSIGIDPYPGVFKKQAPLKSSKIPWFILPFLKTAMNCESIDNEIAQ
jgi:hypothetical protein